MFVISYGLMLKKNNLFAIVYPEFTFNKYWLGRKNELYMFCKRVLNHISSKLTLIDTLRIHRIWLISRKA